MLYFTAEWCSSCKLIAPVIASLAENGGTDKGGNDTTGQPAAKFSVLKIDVDMTPSLMDRMKVSQLPTVLFYENCVLLYSHVGGDGGALGEVTNSFLRKNSNTTIVSAVSLPAPAPARAPVQLVPLPRALFPAVPASRLPTELGLGLGLGLGLLLRYIEAAGAGDSLAVTAKSLRAAALGDLVQRAAQLDVTPLVKDEVTAEGLLPVRYPLLSAVCCLQYDVCCLLSAFVCTLLRLNCNSPLF